MQADPATLTLRPYQHDGVAACRAAMRTARRVLYVAPTGSGKTVLFAYIAASVATKAKRALILVHRRELVRQTADKLASFGIRCGFVVAGKPIDLDPPITVAAVQTLRVRPGLVLAYDLVVIDEAHHVVPGSTWSLVLDRMPGAMVLGVTATPERLDGKGLGDNFDTMVLGPTIKQLQADGFLAQAACYARDGAVAALRSIRKIGGDFNRGELARLMMELPATAAAITDYRELGPGRPGFAFCGTVAHAEAVAQAFSEAGIAAVSVDGKMATGKRDAILEAFAARQLGVLASCELLSEGFDAPEASVALLLRPTLSRALYRQQVGRVLRPKADGGKALVFDFGGNLKRHGLPTMEPRWSLEGRERKPGEAPVKTCPECGTVTGISANICEECGFEWPRPAVDVAEDLTGIRMLIEEQQWWSELALEEPWWRLKTMITTREQLEVIRRVRGYKPGWVWHTAQELGLP